MNMLSFSELSLEDLLPHRGAMMLVKEVLEVDCNHALTRCLVNRSWPMAGPRGVHPLILVEVAAQTAGVCNGWDRVRSKGLDSDKMGWLVGIKKAELSIDFLPFGAEIVSSADNSYNFDNLREVVCEQRMEDIVICRSTLQLFQA